MIQFKLLSAGTNWSIPFLKNFIKIEGLASLKAGKIVSS